MLATLGRVKSYGPGITSKPALRQMSVRRHVLLALAATLLLLGYFQDSCRNAFRSIQTTEEDTPREGIPRVVHLVQLKPSEDAPMHFPFQSFLCVYAAYQFIKPSTIFIHTDHNQSAVDHAVAHGSSWTRKILTMFPDTIEINQVTAPAAAANGLPLVRIEHKSDFVRMEQVAIHGGIYLDWDVLTLRSPGPLLNAGFAAVVGRQIDANINNGCFMARRDSALVRLMNQDMPSVFSGEWQQHSTALITPVAERIAYIPGEVLIMDYKAFAPTSWASDSAGALFSEREASEQPVGLSQQANVDTLDPVERWNNRTKGAEWEMDFSQTYFLHAFKSMWEPLPRFEGITVPYILRRRSNYALAAWPLVMQGIKEGIIDEADVV